MAQGLDAQQMADVAAYYASREPRDRIEADSAVRLSIVRLATIGDPPAAWRPAMRAMARAGAALRERRCCSASRNPISRNSFGSLRPGERDNDLFVRMRTIAAQLTPEEMRGLAIYYGGNPVHR